MYLRMAVSGRMRLLRNFSSQQLMNPSVSATATAVLIFIARAKVRPPAAGNAGNAHPVRPRRDLFHPDQHVPVVLQGKRVAVPESGNLLVIRRQVCPSR
jgi:hypothetical protein